MFGRYAKFWEISYASKVVNSRLVLVKEDIESEVRLYLYRAQLARNGLLQQPG